MACYNYINKEINSELSGTNSTVFIWKSTFSEYKESVIILRDSGKSNNTIRIVYNFPTDNVKTIHKYFNNKTMLL